MSHFNQSRDERDYEADTQDSTNEAGQTDSSDSRDT